MSVEAKIQELLSRTGSAQQINEEQEDLAAAGMADTGSKAAAKMSKDTSKSAKAATAGDTTQPRQGSSKDAPHATWDEDDQNQGAKAAAPVSKAPAPAMKGDAKSVKVPAMEELNLDDDWVIVEEDEDNVTAKVAGHKVTLHRGSTTDDSSTYTLHHPSGAKKVTIGDKHRDSSGEVDGAKVNKAFGLEANHKLGHKIAGSMNGMGGISKFEESVDISSQIKSIFGSDLSEEFTQRAASIFEAAVIARVNSEMEKVTARLEEQAVTQIEEFKEGLVEKVDNYLNYVVEQWMEENQLAVETGLRTEVTEDFISGLKTLFQEHYIEVPEDKYDVMQELQTTSESLQAKLDESITVAIELSKELEDLKRDKILEEQTKTLADTEVEKLKKLVEGVNFESEDLYREKVAVIIENYFPKTASKSPEQVLIEESGTTPTFENYEDQMDRYASSISRSLKAR